MKHFKGKIGPISYKSHRKSVKLYRSSQEVEKKRRTGMCSMDRLIMIGIGKLVFLGKLESVLV